MLKVFVSSTYDDLKDYRAAVIEQLQRMRVDGVKMEYFGASEEDPTTLSLNELEQCNVFIGIIGCRFGALSPDNEHSITQREYMRASELSEHGVIRCLLYLADEHEVRLSPSLIENDNLRQQQQRFRQSLRRHTPRVFRTPTELAAWVSADLYNLNRVPPVPDIDVFEEDDWTVIKEKFDMSDFRIGLIQQFLDFLVDRLSSLFQIDPQHVDVHPLFRETRDKLRNIIPGVSLDDEGGILKRTGVRHVILRQETALLLLRRLDVSTLAMVGEQIGRGAASDLIMHTIERKRLIPASAEAFIVLWDYWDRTGGWGKYLLLPSTESNDTAHGVAEDPPEWKIKIANNFLHVDDIDETHRLCSFWCGYLKGVLNEALPKITEVMSKDVTKGSAPRRLPAYHKVVEVLHEPDMEPMIDIFRIRFQREHLSRSFQTISDAYRQLATAVNVDDFRRVGLLCRYSLEEAKKELAQDFEEQLRGSKMDMESGSYMVQMLNSVSPLPEQRHESEGWFNAANAFIKTLSGR